MLVNRFYKAVDDLFATIRNTQEESIDLAATLVAETAAAGGGIHIHDTGHLINAELVNRAGGYHMFKQLVYKLNVENPVRLRPRDGVDISIEGLSEYVFRASGIQSGDLLFIGSVSGISAGVIDLALTAKLWGVRVVVLTSVSYSSTLQSKHSCGKRLYELGDVVIDNCAPPQDAMLEVDGLQTGLCPASGLAATYIMWAVTASSCGKLLERGITPSVYLSVNCPEGVPFNAEVSKTYEQHGY